MERTRKIYIAKVAVIMGAIPFLVWAHSAGPPSGKSGVPGETTCNQAQCHVGTATNGGGGSVKFTLAGSTYSPGVKQHIVVTISDPSAKFWGFQVAARPSADPKTQAGSFTSTDRFTAVVCNAPPFVETQDLFIDFPAAQNCPANKPLAYIEHTQNGSSRSASGSQTYEFDWTPPATNVGNITLYVAGNAANGNGQETGDHIYTASVELTPAAGGGTAGGGTAAITPGGVVSAGASAASPLWHPVRGWRSSGAVFRPPPDSGKAPISPGPKPRIRWTTLKSPSAGNWPSSITSAQPR